MRALGPLLVAVSLVPAVAPVVVAPAAGAPTAAKVVLGAEAAEAAPRVEARIAEVTVYSDRARVRRRARVALEAGPTVVRLPDLPGAAFLDTVRVSMSAGRVLRVEATPFQRQRLAADETQAVKLLDELDAANDRAAELRDQVAADDWEVGLLMRLSPAPPVPEEKREGRKGLAIDVGSWWKALDFVGQRSAAARVRLVRLADDRRTLDVRRDRLRAELAQLGRAGGAERAVQVVAVLDGMSPAGAADLQLEYFVPGARWKPAYDLHFTSARGEVRLATAAVVEQTTGEDWKQAALSFSTAVPGRGIDLPELLTWTLGERSEFVPRLRPRDPPPAAPPFSPPVPVPVAAPAVGGRALEAGLVRERLARAVAGEDDAADRDADAVPGEVSLLAKSQGGEDRATAGGLALAPPAPGRPPVSPRRFPGPAPSRAGSALPASAPASADDEEEEAAFEVTPLARSRSVLLCAPAISKKSGGSSFTSVPLALYDPEPPVRAPALSDPYLPAVSGGGLDYVYPAPTPSTIESSGRQVRIPLASQSFRAAVYYEATPALATTAFLRARVRNDGRRPLLRGPVTIFGDGELVGQGEIRTTGSSGDLELPLGADQDIRLVRQVVPSTKTTGLIIKSEETTYDVQIQVGNYKKQPVTLDVIDQVPRSRNDKIEIALLGTDPAPRAPADADGVLRFRLDVPAGATRTVKLRFRIVRPRDWVLQQR